MEVKVCYMSKYVYSVTDHVILKTKRQMISVTRLLGPQYLGTKSAITDK